MTDMMFWAEDREGVVAFQMSLIFFMMVGVRVKVVVT
jgi:hypothetical protein